MADQITRAPGPQSFTAAIIWALRELAQEDVPFHTGNLHRKIMQHKGLPDEQTPVLSSSRRSDDRIWIIRRGLPQAVVQSAPDVLEEVLNVSHDQTVNDQPPSVVPVAEDAIKHLGSSWRDKSPEPSVSAVQHSDSGYSTMKPGSYQLENATAVQDDRQTIVSEAETLDLPADTRTLLIAAFVKEVVSALGMSEIRSEGDVAFLADHLTIAIRTFSQALKPCARPGSETDATVFLRQQRRYAQHCPV